MVSLNFDFDLFNSRYLIYERLMVLAFSLIPTFFLIGFVLFTDRKAKEPPKNIIICLLSGILTISIASYCENLVAPYFSSDAVLTYIWAAIEEISKVSIFFLFIFDNKHYDEIYDGTFYMALIALSFAGIENIMYAFTEDTFQNSISLALMRDFTTIPLHVICGIVIGYFVSIANFSKSKIKKYINIFLGILIPSLIHGTFNFSMTLLKNYDNYIEIIFKETLPILLIMVGLFYTAIKYTKKSLELNYIFLNNLEYDNGHKYLMNYNEYYHSGQRNKRIDLYNRTSFNNKKIKFYDKEFRKECS